MASFHEKTSNNTSQEKVIGGQTDAVYVLDERRRAALAEVDNAKFSYVVFYF